MITEGQVIRMSQSDSQPLLWMTVGRLMSEKSKRMTWHSKWMPRLQKFSKKSFWASSSWNWTEGVGSKEEDAPEHKGFWDGVDLHLGAIEQTNARERERERIKKVATIIYQNIKNWRYVCMKMHEHVTWKFKCIMVLAQSNPTSTQHSNKVNTHLKCMKHCYNANVMQCMNS